MLLLRIFEATKDITLESRPPLKKVPIATSDTNCFLILSNIFDSMQSKYSSLFLKFILLFKKLFISQ